MNLILLDESDGHGAGSTVLHGRRALHVRNVLRAKIGDRIRVGILGGRVGDATIEEIGDDAVHLTYRLDQDPPAKLPLTVVLAMPRPKALRRILRTVSELGITRLVVLNSYRVEKSFWQTPLLQQDAVRQALREGLEQARDTVLPEVQLEPLFKPFVEDRLPAIVGKSDAIVAHPLAESGCGNSTGENVTLAIGPEGGFIPYEVEKLIEAGFRSVHLGPRILRVETALPFLAARLFGTSTT